MNAIYFLALVGGILSNIVDQIIDSEILTKYEFISECLFIGIVVCALLYDKYVSFFVSGLFSVGGILGLLLAPHSVNALVWQISTFVCIPFFIYHLLNYRNILMDLSYDDINSFFYFVIPAVALLLLFALLEDYLVPEEYSKKKLLDKAFQTLSMILILYITNFTSLIKETYLKNSKISRMIFNIFILGWLGNVGSSVFFYSYLSHLFIDNVNS